MNLLNEILKNKTFYARKGTTDVLFNVLMEFLNFNKYFVFFKRIGNKFN